MRILKFNYSIIKKVIRRHRNSVPCVLQFEFIECGAASLSMILRKYKRFMPLSTIRRDCGVSRDGSSLLSIKKAALLHGCTAKAYRISLDKLIEDPSDKLPAIAWVNYNHFLVIERFTDKYAYVSDPASGRYRVTIDMARKVYSQMLLVVRPGPDFIAEGKPERQVLSFLPYLQSNLTVIYASLVISLALIVPSIMDPALSGAFVGNFIGMAQLSLGVPILWLSLIVVLLSTSLQFVQLNIIRRLAFRIQRRLSLQILKKLFTVSYSFYATRFLGDIANRPNLADNVTDMLIQQILTFLLRLIGALLILPLIFLISWKLSLISLVYVLITSLVAIYISSIVRDAMRSIQIESAKVSGLTVRMFTDIRTIKASGLEKPYLSNWQYLFAPIFQKNQNIQVTMNYFVFFDSLFSSVFNYGSIALSGFFVMEGSMSLASFMAFQALRSQVTSPLLGIRDVIHQFQQADAEIGRLTDLYTVEDDIKVQTLSSISSPPFSALGSTTTSKEIRSVIVKSNLEIKDGINGSVETVECKLGFSRILPPVISDLNIKIASNSMVTLIGPSGSGKSTIMKTLAGLYDPEDGNILYDGYSWNDYKSDYIRSNIGYVSQEVSAVRGSIYENITLGSPMFSKDDIIDAAKLACFHEVAMDTDHGYETLLGDGGLGLSGGQLQRLEITRALLKRPKILLLDEATSSLDIPTEINLLNNLKEQNITLICVAHRLISAEMSDQIFIIDGGSVAEQGSPKDLKKKEQSLYYDYLIRSSSNS